MVMFIVTGVLSPEEGFSGFIHPATITIACMLVIGSAVFKSGIIDGLSRSIIKLAKIHYVVALIVFCIVTAVFSAFINDTAVVAIMIPMAMLICKETGINPSKLLIPISFAACFGGSATLIGTGTNILITSYAQKSGLDSFGMFEFSKAALVLAGVGFTYMFFVAPFLLPKRINNFGEKMIQKAEKYTAEITLKAGCPDIGKELGSSRLVNEFNVQVLTVIRENNFLYNLSSYFKFKENDVLKILTSPDKLLTLQQSDAYLIHGDNAINELIESEPSEDEEKTTNPENAKYIYEILIPVGSKLAGKSLKELHFRNSYRSSVLAIRHRGTTILENINQLKIREGDMLLIYSSEVALNSLTKQRLAFVISHYEKKIFDYRKAIPTLLITIGVIAAAALNLTSILMSALIGCLLLVTSSILKAQEVYEAIEWKVIFMVAGVLSMGMALEKTGGSVLISNIIYSYLGELGPRITLSLVFLISVLSTNIISGKATAALMAPIVISLSSSMQVSERPFLVAVMFACALTFMTPMSNSTNTMVYAPGNYKYTDYLKIGTPLNIIIWITASLIIPIFFPF